METSEFFKVKVFISSRCKDDNGKYKRIREEIRDAINETKLADVYTFEHTEGSTLPAQYHYSSALMDCDVVIFLINNADGISDGVKEEIEIARNHNIKMIAYFCDEPPEGKTESAPKTEFEEEIEDADYAKSKTVHKFDDLSKYGAQALIDDIAFIYRNYCKGRLVQNNGEITQEADISPETFYQEAKVPQTILKNIDLCKNYLLDMILGKTHEHIEGENIDTCSVDEWGYKFLSVLFDAGIIQDFNSSMFLDELQKMQEDDFHQVVRMRWNAVQSYFSGDIEGCIQSLNAAKKMAEGTNQPTWVIQDILIDLRNQEIILNTSKNRFLNSSAQDELNNINEEIYYPLLDRLDKSLNERYIRNFYKKNIETPYTVTFGNDFDQFGALLASSFVVSIYNGSLTHILKIYDRIRDFIFYLNCTYDNWTFKKELLKYAIFKYSATETRGSQNRYPDALSKMTAEEASKIMSFCNNHPVYYEKLCSKLLAFGIIGYYLNDTDFSKNEKMILEEIDQWLDNNEGSVFVGNYIFTCLNGVAARLSQNVLAQICIKFIDRHYVRWYTNLFQLIDRNIVISKMDKDIADDFIEHIILILDDPKAKEQILAAPAFLCDLRNQEREKTRLLDKKISEKLPEFYDDRYKLDTTKNYQQDFNLFVKKYIEKIRESNASQGTNGHYFVSRARYIAIIRQLLLYDDFLCDSDLINTLIPTLSDTLLISKEGFGTKLDAISLLICIVFKYPDAYKEHEGIFKNIIDGEESIADINNTYMNANIDKFSLYIGISLLKLAMNLDAYDDFLEYMPYIHNNNVETILSVINLIDEYLEIKTEAVFPEDVEALILQNILQWLESDSLQVRQHATKLLFPLMRNESNRKIVSQKLRKLIDSDSASIKTLILRQMSDITEVDNETRNYIIDKCEQDTNFLVRQVCIEIQEH